jgi:hypothetical protein
MPTYTFKDNDTGEQWDDIMKISELDSYKETNNCSTVMQPVKFNYGSTKDMYGKSDGDFRSRMKNLKKFYPPNDALKEW